MSTDPNRVLVAGATGRTGREILTQLRSTDLTVRATTRDASNRTALERRGVDEVVAGDLLDPADAVRAVDDCDAILCAVGTGLSPKHTLGGELVGRTGTKNLLAAAVAAGVSRFVYESAIGVGSSRTRLPLPARLVIRGSLRAKESAEAAIRNSGLTYTILRPGRLTSGPATGDVLVGEGGDSVYGSIPRADVARLMVASLFTPDAENRTFEIVSRRGVRGEVRGLVDVDWPVPRTEPGGP
ncbi:NAD(P)-binding oxidoreductase [Halegenticoccus tardaugens]|uniref:NAD(P)-binding oxidoreductase n=1 Tax=Halegenticoccus tardaugens TaxID=2071624 RepID=UPI00100AD352|nr:NAD(P)-binding oxidoreductase [Halegenticoccus tardaugens]